MYHFRFCMIEWTHDGARVIFSDSNEARAFPHPERMHYHVIAHRCGYGDDLLRYCRERVLAHVMVCEDINNACSYMLKCCSRGVHPSDMGAAIFEEAAAQMLLRWVRANERPIIEGHGWDELRERFLRIASTLDREYIDKVTKGQANENHPCAHPVSDDASPSSGGAAEGRDRIIHIHD